MFPGLGSFHNGDEANYALNLLKKELNIEHSIAVDIYISDERKKVIEEQVKSFVSKIRKTTFN